MKKDCHGLQAEGYCLTGVEQVDIHSIVWLIVLNLIRRNISDNQIKVQHERGSNQI